VTSPADLTHAVLLRVADFIRGLPPELLAGLADGTSKLEVVGRTRARAAPPVKPGPVPAEQVRADLAGIDDRAAATRYLVDLKLNVPQYRALAKELGIAVSGKARKDDVLHELVQWTVGRRLSSDAISRPAPALTPQA
jgi:hypothetical protein